MNPKIITALCLLAALALPTAAPAALYRCQQADGKTRFQDQPCTSALVATPGPGAGRADSDLVKSPGFTVFEGRKPVPKPVEPVSPNARIEAMNRQTEEANRQIEAHNRALRCSESRHDLGVLNEQRPVYRYDSKGERQYLDDAARSHEIVAAQKGVSSNCQ